MRLSTPALCALTLPALMLAACSSEKANDAAAASDPGGPEVNAAVAPGVAFTFAYQFTVPGKAIAAVQQQHSAACERLGPARCRITGLQYDQPGGDDIKAQTEFLLAPDLAQRFGSEGVAVIEQASGKLDRATINGENAGGAIVISQQNSAAVQAEIARLDLRLKSTGLATDERVELQQQIAGLAAQLRGAAQDRRQKEASIASTPVTFTYQSQGVLAGGGAFGKAASASLSSAGTLLAILTLIAGYAAPWALLAGLGLWGWKAWKRRDRRTEVTETDPTITHAI